MDFITSAHILLAEARPFPRGLGSAILMHRERDWWPPQSAGETPVSCRGAPEDRVWHRVRKGGSASPASAPALDGSDGFGNPGRPTDQTTGVERHVLLCPGPLCSCCLCPTCLPHPTPHPHPPRACTPSVSTGRLVPLGSLPHARDWIRRSCYSPPWHPTVLLLSTR